MLDRKSLFRRFRFRFTWPLGDSYSLFPNPCSLFFYAQ